MTYCVAMRVDEGLVFLADTRTNAGVDHISTFRKMTILEVPNNRVITLMTSGNLAISQAVRQKLLDDEKKLCQANSMFDMAELVGNALREVYQKDANALQEFGIDFNCSFLVGGQIKDEECRLFQVYAAGNFIEATNENPYFQIGEAKYGKPILDRMIKPHSGLEEAAKCALISMDSTLRSNISVGLPLDLFCYKKNSLMIEKFAHISNKNPYYSLIHNTWGERLQQVFSEIPNPTWDSETAPYDNVVLNGGNIPKIIFNRGE
jgi:putative proteasome-type protease